MRRLARSVVGATRRGALVLVYHRAAKPSVDPWRLSVTPEHLGEHLALLARHCRLLSASQLEASLALGRVPDRAVLVTFDDGYADLASEIRPRLERAGVPAVMFLVSSAIGSGREFWWDSLERVLLSTAELPARLELTAGGRTYGWDVAGDNRRAVHDAVWFVLRAQPPSLRDELAEQVLRWAGLPLRARDSHRPLTATELARLASDELIEIGAHTARHGWLAGLTPDEQQLEIVGGRRQLEQLLGRPVATFAYPHGTKRDVTPTTLAIVRQARFVTAFMASPGTVSRSINRYALPRLFVRDMDGDAFARLLWLHGGIRTG